MIIGIDPSLVATGVCYGTDSPQFLVCRSKPTKPDVRSRIARFSRLAADVTVVGGQDPTHIYIEGYSFGSKTAGQSSIAEYGGILRLALSDTTEAQFVEVPPASLKKFFTGKGNAKKHDMLAHARDRYNQTVTDDNLVDAFALWRLGRLCTMTYPDLIDEIEADGFDYWQDKQEAF